MHNHFLNILCGNSLRVSTIHVIRLLIGYGVDHNHPVTPHIVIVVAKCP